MPLETIDIIFGSVSLAFLAMALGSFHLYKKYRLKNDIFLGLYFLSSGQAFWYLFFIPSDLKNSQFLYITLQIASMSIVFTMLFLSLFLDYSGGDKLSLFSYILMGLVGVIIALLYPYNHVDMIWIDSELGSFPMLIYNSQNAKVAFILIYIFGIFFIIHFNYYGLRSSRLVISNRSFIVLIRVILTITAGLFSWIVFSILKRLHPETYLGFDFLFMGIFHLLFFYYYVKNRPFFYILSELPLYCLIINKGPRFFVEYDFQSQNLIDSVNTKLKKFQTFELIHSFALINNLEHSCLNKENYNKNLRKKPINEKNIYDDDGLSVNALSDDSLSVNALSDDGLSMDRYYLDRFNNNISHSISKEDYIKFSDKKLNNIMKKKIMGDYKEGSKILTINQKKQKKTLKYNLSNSLFTNIRKITLISYESEFFYWLIISSSDYQKNIFEFLLKQSSSLLERSERKKLFKLCNSKEYLSDLALLFHELLIKYRFFIN